MQIPDFLDIQDFEIVPPPANETPREMLQRMWQNEKSFPELENITWQQLHEIGALEPRGIFTRLVAVCPYVDIVLKRKSS